MCGLVGGTLFNSDTVAEALQLIAHRGRDHTGAQYYEEGRLWLGHNRLAIQDLGAQANQPLEVGDISVVFNGELWRRSMDGSGYSSDTRLLADSYLEQREAGLVNWARGLDGMFALVIYDKPRQVLVFARDWLGRIPLYYTLDSGGIAFASEAKALTRPLDRRFTGNEPRAQAKSQVKLFPAGCVATYSLVSSRLEITPFRDFNQYKEEVPVDDDSADLGEEYYATGVRDHLRAAVENEAIADVPICTILSGGVDSTLITALLAEQVPGLKAYTVSVGPSNGKDDLAFARRAAASIGVELVEVILTKEEIESALFEAVWAVEDSRWVQVAPAVPQIAMARRIGADGYKVVFGGEGSDELFGSYGDVRRWSWEPQQYHAKRIKLCERLGDNNVIRGNKAMMFGGTVELRTPFLDNKLVDFCLKIPTRYRSNNSGKGSVMKPLLRKAFSGLVPDNLLMRPKVTFQEGAHSDFLKAHQDYIKTTLGELFNGRGSDRTSELHS